MALKIAVTNLGATFCEPYLVTFPKISLKKVVPEWQIGCPDKMHKTYKKFRLE